MNSNFLPIRVYAINPSWLLPQYKQVYMVYRSNEDTQASKANRYTGAQITITLDANNEVNIKDNLINSDKRFDESPYTVKAYIELLNVACEVGEKLKSGKQIVTTAMQERYNANLVTVGELKPKNQVVSWPLPDFVIAGSMLDAFAPMEVVEILPIKVDWWYLVNNLVWIQADETIGYIDLDEDQQYRLQNHVEKIPNLHDLDTDAYLVKLTDPNNPSGHGITYVIDLNDRIMPDDIPYKRWSLVATV